MNQCANCGASLAPDAKFCQRCGTPVAAPPVPPEAPAVPPPVAAPAAAPKPGARPIGPGVSYTPVQPQKRSTWWIIPLVIVGIVVIAWLLLAGLPFGRDENRVVATQETETIAEGTATAGEPMNSGTLIEVPGDEPMTTETTAPPMATDTTGSLTVPAPVPPPAPAPTATQPPAPAPTQTQPPPPVQPQPQPRPQPRPVTPPPASPAPAPAPSSEISESEAAATLSSYVRSNNPYDTRGDCLQVRSQGYRNAGYTFSVWDACVSGGGSRMLGRWRVDSKTREVFRQSDDGRYLRP